MEDTMKTLYELHRDGSWDRWEQDFFGNWECRKNVYAPREVRDCAKFNRCAGVVLEGFRARPARSNERPARPSQHREVVVERRTVIRHDDDGAAAAGALAGLIIGAVVGAAASKK